MDAVRVCGVCRQKLREPLYVSHWEDVSRLPGNHEIGAAANPVAHQARPPATHGLVDHQTPGLALRRQYQDICCEIGLRDFRLIQESREPDRQFQGLDRLLALTAQGAVTHHQSGDRWTALGGMLERVQKIKRTLIGQELAREDKNRVARLETPTFPQRGAFNHQWGTPLREQWIHSMRNVEDPVRSGSVMSKILRRPLPGCQTGV